MSRAHLPNQIGNRNVKLVFSFLLAFSVVDCCFILRHFMIFVVIAVISVYTGCAIKIKPLKFSTNIVVRFHTQLPLTLPMSFSHQNLIMQSYDKTTCQMSQVQNILKRSH